MFVVLALHDKSGPWPWHWPCGSWPWPWPWPRGSCPRLHHWKPVDSKIIDAQLAISAACSNLLCVRVAHDVAGGRSTVTAVTTVEVIRAVRNTAKLQLMGIKRAAGTASSAAKTMAAHVIDHHVNVNPQ